MGGDENDLRGLIKQLGLSLQEAAALAGLPGGAISRDPGRRSYAPLLIAAQRLASLAREIDRWVAAEIDKIRQSAAFQSAGEIRLLIYRRDEDLPAWTECRFASIHRVAMAKIAAAFPDRPTALIVFERDAYFRWLAGGPDAPDARATWAAQAAKDRKFYFKIGGAFASSAATGQSREAPRFRLRRRRPRAAKTSVARSTSRESDGKGLGDRLR